MSGFGLVRVVGPVGGWLTGRAVVRRGGQAVVSPVSGGLGTLSLCGREESMQIRRHNSPPDSDPTSDGVSRVASLTEGELNSRIRAGQEAWSELLEKLNATGGLLPGPVLVRRLREFLEGDYRPAMEAHIEGVLRSLRADRDLGRQRRGLER